MSEADFKLAVAIVRLLKPELAHGAELAAAEDVLALLLPCPACAEKDAAYRLSEARVLALDQARLAAEARATAAEQERNELARMAPETRLSRWLLNKLTGFRAVEDRLTANRDDAEGRYQSAYAELTRAQEKLAAAGQREAEKDKAADLKYHAMLVRWSNLHDGILEMRKQIDALASPSTPPPAPKMVTRHGITEPEVRYGINPPRPQGDETT